MKRWGLRLGGMLVGIIMALSAYGQEHMAVSLVISPQDYALSPSGRTLVLWKGDQAKINMATDPVLNRIDTIGRYAFHALDSLGKMVPNPTVEELVLPPSLRVVEEGAFYCSSLEKIYLNNRLERLGWGAFIDCALTEVYLPASLRHVEAPFIRCMHLDRVEVAEESPYLAVENGALIDKTTKALVYYPTGILYTFPLLPEEVLSIAPWAFAHNPYIQKIALPKGVRHVAEDAFSACSSLVSVDLPATVGTVGANAWRYSPVDTVILRSDFPPQIEGDARFLVARKPAHLYVQASALALYAGNEFWAKHFATIESVEVLEEFAQKRDGDELPFYLVDRMLYLTLPEGVREARLFNQEGTLVKVLSYSGGHPLLPGAYLLRIGTETHKIVCRDNY